MHPAQPLILFGSLTGTLLFIGVIRAIFEPRPHDGFTKFIDPIPTFKSPPQVRTWKQAITCSRFQWLGNPPLVGDFVYKTKPQDARTYLEIVPAFRFYKIRTWASFSFLGFIILGFSAHVPAGLLGQPGRAVMPAQVLDVLGNFVAYRAGDDKSVGAVMLLTPAGNIFFPFFHDLAIFTRFLVLIGIPFLLLFRREILPVLVFLRDLR